MALKFKKIKMHVKSDKVCVGSMCGIQTQKPIVRPIVTYEVNSSKGKEYLILGIDKENYLTSGLYDSDMKLKKQNDSKTTSDYTGYSKASLRSRKKFSEEGNIGKARVTYQLLQDWG